MGTGRVLYRNGMVILKVMFARSAMDLSLASQMLWWRFLGGSAEAPRRTWVLCEGLLSAL